MCRQTSNGLIPIPTDNLSLNESNENPIETIMNLFLKNSKPCVTKFSINTIIFFSFSRKI